MTVASFYCFFTVYEGHAGDYFFICLLASVKLLSLIAVCFLRQLML